MSCPRANCNNVQCYLCSETCDYTHFYQNRDVNKEGKCPLYNLGKTEEIHENQVRQAAAVARTEILQRNPDIDPKTLEVDFSDEVKRDDAKRKTLHEIIEAPWALRPGEFMSLIRKSVHCAP